MKDLFIMGWAESLNFCIFFKKHISETSNGLKAKYLALFWEVDSVLPFIGSDYDFSIPSFQQLRPYAKTILNDLEDATLPV